jgi:Ca2+-binding RTX toxin-like protein
MRSTTIRRLRRAAVLTGAALVLSGSALAPTAFADPSIVSGDPVPYNPWRDCFGSAYLPVTFINGAQVTAGTFGVIYARPGVAITSGTSGDDVIIGTSGDDFINGYGGDDRICGGSGADTLIGGVIGTEGSDVDHIDGEDGRDIVEGGPDNDELHGGHDEDTVRGGDGNDSLYGESKVDYLVCEGGAFDIADGGPGLDGPSTGHGCETYNQ